VGALFLAGFTQGALGFGFGIVAMAFLPLAISIHQATPLVVVFTVPLMAFSFCLYRRHFQWRDGWLLILGSCLGIPIGVYALAILSETVLLRTLGALLLAFVLHESLQRRMKRSIEFPPWSAAAVGVLSGAGSGAFNIGGPPLVAYAYAQPWSKERVVAFLQVVFFVSATLRLTMMWSGGFITPDVLRLAVWGALPAGAALLLGTLLLRRIPTEKLRTGVFLFIGVMALKYLIWT
jgi:uncharacterized membrane protein YfcA